MQTTTRLSDLGSRAMLAGLSISVWRGQKMDRQVTAKANADHGAAHDAGRYNKHCLRKSDIEAITRAISGAKEAYYRLTSPWADSGMRILSCENHDALINAVETAEIELAAALREIAPRWPAIIEANRARLGDMFDPADYPADIASRYSIKLSRMAIPSGADFRVDLDADQLARARAGIEQDVSEALEKATRDVLSRMLPPVLAMADRLTKFRVIIGADGKPRTENPFRDSLVENMREIAKFLPSMNLTGNAEVARLIEQIGELAERDPTEYRQGGRGGRLVREETARKASELASEVESILREMGETDIANDMENQLQKRSDLLLRARPAFDWSASPAPMPVETEDRSVDVAPAPMPFDRDLDHVIETMAMERSELATLAFSTAA